MSKAVRIHEYGGPDIMRWETIPLPEPGPSEVLIEQKAVGLNYIDVYYRTGLYKAYGFPFIIGQEGAGIVTALGADVTTVAVGDRVAYANALGAYATHRVIPSEKLVKLPDAVSFDAAASLMLQGLTAQYLLHRTYKVKAGDTVVVHAAAGGVGLLLCQWARHLGVTVIGVVSTEAKADLARQNGASHVVVGTDTFQASLNCLAPLGLMVCLGNASGPVPPVDISLLSAKGSLFLTRPSLATYIAKRADLEKASADLFAVVASGAVRAAINQTFPLQEAAAAHTALEARQTTGSTVLIP
jgi:NADPH2:quinone reductase